MISISISWNIYLFPVGAGGLFLQFIKKYLIHCCEAHLPLSRCGTLEFISAMLPCFGGPSPDTSKDTFSRSNSYFFSSFILISGWAYYPNYQSKNVQWFYALQKRSSNSLTIRLLSQWQLTDLKAMSWNLYEISTAEPAWGQGASHAWWRIFITILSVGPATDLPGGSEVHFSECLCVYVHMPACVHAHMGNKT